MKKLFVLVFAIALCLGVLCVGASADYSGTPEKPAQGDGTVDDPYKISSAENLYWFAGLVNGTLTDGTAQNKAANAVLMADIIINTGVLNAVASGITPANTWTPIGSFASAHGLPKYTGTFDGQGHTISGLYYSGSGYGGLFGCVGIGGQVKNVKVADSYINGKLYVGGVCGANNGTITNCSFDGSVTGKIDNEDIFKDLYVGGVCGASTGTVEDSSNSGTVTCDETGFVYAGGVSGYNNSGTITNCYNTGNVTGSENVGGVCGDNGGTITNCYNTGNVNGSGNGVGGVCGNNDGTITNCYNTGSVTGSENVGGVCGYNGYHRTIDNCYWLNSGLVGIGGSHEGSTANNVESKTNDQFASGEVAWLLNQGQEYDPWRQNLSGDKDNDPVLNSTHQKVVKLTVDSAVSYLNSGDEVEEPAEGKVYVDGDGKIVQTPYTVEADTTLTSKHPVTAAIDITSTLTKVYDGTKAAPEGLSIALEGVVSGDDVTATATCSFEDANVGNGKAITASNITLTGDDAREYVLRDTTAETYAGEITPRTVTIIADDKTAKRGEDMPVLTYTANGFIGGDTMTPEPELSCDADMTVAGTYEIIVSGGSSSSNYTLAYQKGTLTVNNRWLVTVKYGNDDADVSSYVEPGSSFKLPETPSKSGYYFVGWSDGNTTYKAGAMVENITADTTFTAVWREINIPDPNGITVTQPANGSIKVNPSNGSAGTLITVTATPDEGYELAYITVDGEKITGNTFRMPDKSVTVSAVFVPATFPFVDVKTGDWFYDYVAYVYSNGLMDGTSATTFEPNANMTRAMVWAILARIDGETVTGAAWATDARAWAMAEGVSDGTDPNGLVTREQFATMLYRYAVAKGYDVSIGESTNILSYADFASISEYAIPAMQWVCGSGIVTGVTDTTLVPQGTATRAQCAAMLMRFAEL